MIITSIIFVLKYLDSDHYEQLCLPNYCLDNGEPDIFAALHQSGSRISSRLHVVLTDLSLVIATSSLSLHEFRQSSCSKLPNELS